VHPIGIATGLAVSLAAFALAAAPTSARRTAMCPHPGTINGVSVLIDCGPAKATMRFRGASVKYANGLCQRNSSNFTLGFGAVLTGLSSKRPPDTFQLIAGGGTHPATHDGVYSATLQLMRSGHGYVGETIKLTLTHKRGAGSFTGTVKATTTNATFPVSGSFTC